ncbi:DUF2281 domain-containing protein [Anaerolineae bacterium CFX7]|nr:DUF2281 domain-containing protein [Anaerolineae bacterium CFX7]
MTVKQMNESIKALPPESMEELAVFVQYLQYKYQRQAIRKRRPKPTRLKDLHGILKGYDFSPEKIAEARREMWGNFGREHLLDEPEK